MRRIAPVILFALALAAGENQIGTARNTIRITHGVTAGDVTSNTAVVWARADRRATMSVRYYPVGGEKPQKATAANSAASDFTAKVKLTSLQPGTTYRYEVEFAGGGERSSVEAGTFRTAPSGDMPSAVSFIWGGDLGGQWYCRRPDVGYAIFEPMAASRADFFIASGDMIYADVECPAQGPGSWSNIPGDFPAINDSAVDWRNADQVREVYAGHWRYNRQDRAFQELLRTTPIYAQWDDHEVINDFGARWQAFPPTPDRLGYAGIVAAGRKALFDFNPIDRHPEEPDRIYRSFRWGRDLELFIVDARSYRSENALSDHPDSAKTMLGAEQLSWLKASLVGSTATWKVVSIDVPLAIPTGGPAGGLGRDSWADGEPGSKWATGFEREQRDLLAAIDRGNVRNVVFITADVHFAAQLRFELDLDGDGDMLLFHELVAGPLNASRRAPPALDPTLHPVVLYAEGEIFNFGTIRIGDGTAEVARLRADIRDETGRIRPGSELELAPEP